MATVASTLERVKLELHKYLPARFIEQVCHEAGHTWRKRQFDPVTTLQLFVLQVLHFNTAITHLRFLAKRPINAAAYCQARLRLPLCVFQKLLEHSRVGHGRRGRSASLGRSAYLSRGCLLHDRA